MFSTLASYLLAPLFVFGVYHLLTWIDVMRINARPAWKRVAIASGVSHILLATGFFVFAYLEAAGADYGPFLFNRTAFWRMATIFDIAPTLLFLAVFTLLGRLGISPPGVLFLTVAIIYAVGTLQWFLVGGALGAILEKFWEGLKTPEPEDDQWL